MDERQIQQILQERDKLRLQNEQLWAIVNKQKELIKQLKFQQNMGDTNDSTEDLINQVGRDSKANNRSEAGDRDARMMVSKPTTVDPPSPFQLDLNHNNEDNNVMSSKESIAAEPQPLKLKQFGSQKLHDDEELKKSQILSTPLNINPMASNNKLFTKSLNNINEEAGNNVVTGLKNVEPLFVKSMKKSVDGTISKVYYIFQLWSLGNTLCFIEKGQDDFELLFKSIKSTTDDVPFLPENRLYSLGATGNILQGWIKNVCNQFPDNQHLLKFMNTSIIEQNDLRESFKKQGMLYKKGNYFGVWKARYYELDTATGNVYYSEQVYVIN